MIDFLLGALLASACWGFALHSRSKPGSTGLPATLLEGLRNVMSQIAEDIKTEIDVKIAAAVQAATDAANASVADLRSQLDTANADLADVKAHLDALPG